MDSANRDATLVLDRYGMALSIGCAIHCAVLPIAMSLLAASGLAWIAGPEFEWSILACTFTLGSWRLGKSFRQHRRPIALILFALGLVSFAAAKMEWASIPNSEAVFMVLGGSLVAFAHFRNLRICSCCHGH